MGELRNAIVHHPLVKEKAIAEPHEETVIRLKELHNIITDPQKIFPIFQSDILGANEEDNIREHLLEMKKHYNLHLQKIKMRNFRFDIKN